MHPQALLLQLTELLREVLRFDAPADRVVSAHFRHQRQLGARERHVLAETVYEVLRQRLCLQALAQGGQGPLERRLALLGWQGDETVLSRAAFEPEMTWRRERLDLSRADLPLKQQLSLPDWVWDPLVQQLGEDEALLAAKSFLQPAPLDVRVNALKMNREQAREELASHGISSILTPYSPWGLRLEGKPPLASLELFKSGAIEVQDEGSQLLGLITEAKRGEMVMDLCAGAGGKTLVLGAMMRSTGRLYACDVSGHRLEALRPRLARSGLSNVYPVQISHERDERLKRLQGKIDRVLVDAPCSGLGTLRRNPDLKWRQSPQSIAELSIKQISILKAAGRLLKPGGRLVYATCSFLKSENDDVIANFIQDDVKFEQLHASSVLLTQKIGCADELVQGANLRLWPHRHHTDGFFAAVLQKKA